MVELNAYLFATAVAPLRLGAPLTLNPIVFSLSFRRPRPAAFTGLDAFLASAASRATRPVRRQQHPPRRPPPRARRSDPIPSFLLIGPSVFFSFVSGPFYLSFSRRNLSPPNNGALGRPGRRRGLRHRATIRAPRAHRLLPPVPAGPAAGDPVPALAPHPPPRTRRQRRPRRFFNFEKDRRIEHLEIALARRGQDSSASKVGTLRITSSLGGSLHWPGATPYSSSRLPTRERSISPCPMTVR